MVSILGKNVYIDTNTFRNNQTIVNVDLCNKAWVNNSMANAFYACFNLSSVTNINNAVTDMFITFHNCQGLITPPVIPNSVTNMRGTFEHCYNLTTAPKIPNSVTSMYSCFFSCYNLVDAPIIPNSVTHIMGCFQYCRNLINGAHIPDGATSLFETYRYCYNLTNVPNLGNNVTDLEYTFYGCYNLTNVPTIPNSVTNMFGTFRECSNLITAPIIPESVINAGYIFDACTNLTGNIYIKSDKINYAYNCFNRTSLIKNVYIPFTYNNGVNTLTYNSFINAGYKTDGSVNGVYLKDANEIIKLYTWRDTEHNITIYTISDSPSVGDRIFKNDGSSYGVSENIGSSLYVKNNNIVSTSPSENKVVFYASSSGVLTDTITCNCIRYAEGDVYASIPLSISITSLDPNSKGSLTVDRYVNNVNDGAWYTSFTTDSSGNVNNAIYIPKDKSSRYGFMIDETNNTYTGWNCISIGNDVYQGYVELQTDIWTGYFNNTYGVSVPITNNITIHMMSPEEEKAIWGVDDTQYTITQSGSTIYLNTYIGTNTSVVVPRSKT